MNYPEKKITSIASVKTLIKEGNSIILVNYKGVKAEVINKFRRDLKEENANLKILKNNLVRIALKDSIKDESIASELSKVLEGQVGISYSKDPVSLSRIVVAASNINKEIQVKIGYAEGGIIDTDKIKNLSSFGSSDAVKSQLLGTLSSVSSQLLALFEAKNGNTES